MKAISDGTSKAETLTRFFRNTFQFIMNKKPRIQKGKGVELKIIYLWSIPTIIHN